MSGRREKREKSKFSIWIPIICIIVVGIIFYMLNDNKIKDGQEQNTVNQEESNNIISNNEIIEENIVNEDIENTLTVENEVENVVNNTVTNIVENEVKNTIKNTTTSTNTGKYQPGVTDKKQKAIELVKENWGSDSSVNFAFEYINENGEYVISVKDKSSATVRNYFRVDLQTETVELD